MTTWEYKVEKLVLICATGGQTIGIQKQVDPNNLIEKRLNEIGKDGWELVDFSPPPPGTCNPPVFGVFYFKRPSKSASGTLLEHPLLDTKGAIA